MNAYSILMVLTARRLPKRTCVICSYYNNNALRCNVRIRANDHTSISKRSFVTNSSNASNWQCCRAVLRHLQLSGLVRFWPTFAFTSQNHKQSCCPVGRAQRAKCPRRVQGRGRGRGLTDGTLTDRLWKERRGRRDDLRQNFKGKAGTLRLETFHLNIMSF